jgi:hypothetical protein
MTSISFSSSTLIYFGSLLSTLDLTP